MTGEGRVRCILFFVEVSFLSLPALYPSLAPELLLHGPTFTTTFVGRLNWDFQPKRIPLPVFTFLTFFFILFVIAEHLFYLFSLVTFTFLWLTSETFAFAAAATLEPTFLLLNEQCRTLCEMGLVPSFRFVNQIPWRFVWFSRKLFLTISTIFPEMPYPSTGCALIFQKICMCFYIVKHYFVLSIRTKTCTRPVGPMVVLDHELSVSQITELRTGIVVSDQLRVELGVLRRRREDWLRRKRIRSWRRSGICST